MSCAFAAEQSPRSAYVHIPFCVHKCAYCDFPSCAGQERLYPAYVGALLREMEQVYREEVQAGREPLPLETVYFGGGTPSVLPPATLGRCLARLQSLWGLEAGAEVTVEINPGTVEYGALEALAQEGFTRLSIGLQAAQNHLLRRLERIHQVEDFCRLSQEALDLGFQNRSCDLMLGLPGQRMENLQASLQLAMDYDYPHVSVYSLILEESTAFYTRYASHPEALPTEEEERRQQHFVGEFLAQYGLQSYEISNYARPGFASRHNLIYWEAKPYFGFGSGAHAYVGGERRGSLFPPQRYIEALERGGELHPLEEVVDVEAAQKEFFLLGFRKTEGIRRADFLHRFGEAIPEAFLQDLLQLVREGLLVETEEGWALSPRGQDVGNQVFLHFV